MKERTLIVTPEECERIKRVIDKLQYVEHAKKASSVCYLSSDDILKCIEAGVFHRGELGINVFGRIIKDIN